MIVVHFATNFTEIVTIWKLEGEYPQNSTGPVNMAEYQ